MNSDGNLESGHHTSRKVRVTCTSSSMLNSGSDVIVHHVTTIAGGASIWLLTVLMVVSELQSSPDSLWNSTCPVTCICGTREVAQLAGRLLNTVECTNSRLQDVPRYLPAGSEALLLKANKIQMLELSTLPLSTTRVLDLSHNMLTQLSLEVPTRSESTNDSDTITPSGIFSNMSSLIYLNLQNNLLRMLTNETFTGLHALETLLLDTNQITFIEKSTFRSLNRLRSLTLNSNRLQIVNRHWFADLASLSVLDMSHNAISSLEPSSFQDLRQLTELNLEHNQLQQIRRQSFQGIIKLQTLSLTGNNFTRVPTRALSAFTNLKTLRLGSNPISSLDVDTFEQVHVREVHLHDLPALVVVDEGAFSNIQELTALYMHDNPRLTYLDPHTFDNVPDLEILDIHHNKLISLPLEVLESLPSLTRVDLRDNPLRCDCNIKWMSEAMHSNNDSRITAGHSHVIDIAAIEELVCDAPSDKEGQLVYDLTEAFPDRCAPVIVGSLNATYQMPATSSLSLVCRAVGTEASNLHWMLSNGKVINQTSNYSRIKLLNGGTLMINHLKPSDAGRYTCIASNGAGKTSYATQIRVHNNDIHLNIKTITSKSLTTTWNGTVASSKYVIIYRRMHDVSGLYCSVHIKPFMREYTIRPLEGGTQYEFCVGYEYYGVSHKLNCQQIQTLPRAYASAMKRAVSMRMIVILVTCLAGAAAAMCVLASVINVCRQRGYKDPEYETRIAGRINPNTAVKPEVNATNYSATMRTGSLQRTGSLRAGSLHGSSGMRTVSESRLEEMSQIPLDNLYPPSSTPLCTSTTSLISNHHKL